MVGCLITIACDVSIWKKAFQQYVCESRSGLQITLCHNLKSVLAVLKRDLYTNGYLFTVSLNSSRHTPSLILTPEGTLYC